MLTVITGNILSAPEQYLAHQCNCVTTYAKGLAEIIFIKWYFADCYTIRWKPDVPGNIEVRGNGRQNRFIINMFAQVNPGKPPTPEDERDGFQARKSYFISCMKQIEALNPQSVAMPWEIGCGMAGGDWDFYKKVIDNFASRINITLYKLPEKK